MTQYIVPPPIHRCGLDALFASELERRHGCKVQRSCTVSTYAHSVRRRAVAPADLGLAIAPSRNSSGRRGTLEGRIHSGDYGQGIMRQASWEGLASTVVVSRSNPYRQTDLRLGAMTERDWDAMGTAALKAAGRYARWSEGEDEPTERPLIRQGRGRWQSFDTFYPH